MLQTDVTELRIILWSMRIYCLVINSTAYLAHNDVMCENLIVFGLTQ